MKENLSTSPPGPLSKGEGESAAYIHSQREGESNMQFQSLDKKKLKIGKSDLPGYIMTDAETWYNSKENARSNRNKQTEAEKILWSKLRNKKLGYRFRRQHVILNYIVDFVCIDKMLIIEVDGEIHKNQKEYDEVRTNYLKTLGFNVIRFDNETIKNNIDSVVKSIQENL